MPLPPIGSTQSMAIYNQQGAFTTSGVKEDDASTLPAPETFGSIQPCNDQVSQPGTQPNPCSDNVVCSQGCTADACTAEGCPADACAGQLVSGVKEDDASTLPAPETFGSIQPCNDQVSQPGTQPNPCSDNVVCGGQACTAEGCPAAACTADAPAPCNDATCGGEACAADACAANAEQPPPPTGSL